MYAKAEISGVIEIKTGLHIGASSAFSAIGAVDSPVIKDPLTGLPVIPGSSLKGKMRSLLAKKYNETVATKPNEDADVLTELFGYAGTNKAKTSRVLFSDMILDNWEEMKKQGASRRTEVKFENAINRVTAVANPRQIERVIRGSKFPLRLIYEVTDEETMKKDFSILRDGFELLQYDYLGGNGSRGYGQVEFHDLAVEIVVGEVAEETVAACQELLNGVEGIG